MREREMDDAERKRRHKTAVLKWNAAHPEKLRAARENYRARQAGCGPSKATTKGPRPLPLPDRVMRHVAPPDENGCRKWTGTTGEWGHGLISPGGRHGSPVRAHRVTYEMAFGPIPDGLSVLHACNVPSCVNPLHLYAGTAKQNTADMIRAGTFPRGERSGMARLTAAQVESIRREYVSGQTETMREVGRRYGVRASTIHRIVHRQAWAE